VLSKILSVQISACFADPLLDLLDVYGRLMRYVIGPLFAKTQSDINKLWTGRTWKLAGILWINFDTRVCVNEEKPLLEMISKVFAPIF
jgi:hypothetical protein